MSKKFNPSCGDIYDVHKEMKADLYSAYHCQHALSSSNMFAHVNLVPIQGMYMFPYLKHPGKAPLEVQTNLYLRQSDICAL